MAREELVISLQNAVERGQSLEEAIQTLINAGYDISEVREASGYVNIGVLGAISTMPAVSPPVEKLKKPKKRWLLILLVIILVLLVGGLIASIFFGEQILDVLLGR